MNITSSDITNLLKKRYEEKYVCVPECNTGRHGSQRIDMWVMAKSWAHPRTIAFEIKVTRQDFLHDHKWRGYLPYCSEFYFVAPPGIIQPDELPPEAGLLVTSKKCTMLYTKKKAPHRKVTIPDSIYRYILMWRVKLDRSSPHLTKYDLQYWKNWLATKDENKEIGYNVSKKLSTLVRERIKAVESENRKLLAENKRCEEIRDIMQQLGITSWKSSYHDSFIKQRLEEVCNGVPGGLLKSIESTINTLQKVYTELSKGVQ